MNSDQSIASRTDVPPDVASSSNEYALRFSGKIGEYFLALQKNSCLELLNKFKVDGKPNPISSVLEIGGGHCQLTQMYLDLGYSVTIQGSDDRSFKRAKDLGFDKNPRVTFLVCSLTELPLANSSFDLVSAIRLLAHVENWQIFLKEISRVSKSFLLLDFANLYSFNLLSPVLFQIKKKIEKSTRPFNCQTKTQITNELLKLNFSEIFYRSQYIFPMGIHRLFRNVSLSTALENLASRFGSDSFGSPLVCLARKENESTF